MGGAPHSLSETGTYIYITKASFAGLSYLDY